MKINSYKWIKDLNVWLETPKLTEEILGGKVGGNALIYQYKQGLSNMGPSHSKNKAKNWKIEPLEIKRLCIFPI